MNIALLGRLQTVNSFHMQLFQKTSNMSHLFLFASLAYVEFKIALLACWICAS